jgi:aldehyde dehydrogenase (NAD+)
MTVPVPDSKLAGEARRILASLGVDARRLEGAQLVVRSPIDGRPLATLDEATAAEANAAVGRAHAAFLKWRSVPAPRRGELVRLLGEELRAAKAELGRLVTIEVGKVESEGLGEVQEMIDICDFAVGLSRQLYGLTIQSERPDHKLVEAWRPSSAAIRSCGNPRKRRRCRRWRSRRCTAARRRSSAPTRLTTC